jgi:hypothetical protein
MPVAFEAMNEKDWEEYEELNRWWDERFREYGFEPSEDLDPEAMWRSCAVYVARRCLLVKLEQLLITAIAKSVPEVRRLG